MSCRLDVRKAIIKNILNKFVEGRNTFQYDDNGNITIVNVGTNSDSKAKRASQARAIAENLADRISEYSNKHIMGWVTRASEFDPYTVSLIVSPAYIEEQYQKLSADQKTDPADNELSTKDLAIIEENKSKMDSLNRMLIESSPKEFLKFIAEQSYGISGADSSVQYETPAEYSVKPILELAQRIFPKSSFIKPDALPPIIPEC